MDISLEFIILMLVFALIFTFLIYQNEKVNKHKQKCTCGKQKYCESKIYVRSNGSSYRKNKEFFKCGKVQEDIKKLRNLKIK